MHVIIVIYTFNRGPINDDDGVSEFLKKVKHAVENYGYCSIVVSEGVQNSKGQFLADAGTRDAFGHAQLGGVAPVVANLVREKLGYKYHWAVSDYLQR